MQSGCKHAVETNPQPYPIAQPFGEDYSIPETVTVDSGEAWWHALNTPDLEQMIHAALDRNLDIKVLYQQLIQAEALVVRSGAARRVQGQFQLNAQSSIDSDDERQTRLVPGIGLGWQTDLRGKVGFERFARESELLAQSDLLDLARLNVSIEVALTYLELVFQFRLESLLLAQRANAVEFLEVVKARFDQGIATRLDVLQQEGLVAEISAQIPLVKREFNRTQLRMDVLTGSMPQSIPDKWFSAAFPDVGHRANLVNPLDLLLQRPDLRSYQQLVVAADADLGAALADRWPQLRLELDLVWSEGTDSSTGLLSLAAGLLQPLFDGGRRAANITSAAAFRNERWLLFSARFLSAVGDLEEGLYAEERLAEGIQHLNSRQRLLLEQEAQATARYEQGFTDYLPVITAKQDLLNIEQRLLREQRNLQTIRLELIRTIGGPMPSTARGQPLDFGVRQ